MHTYPHTLNADGVGRIAIRIVTAPKTTSGEKMDSYAIIGDNPDGIFESLH